MIVGTDGQSGGIIDMTGLVAVFEAADFISFLMHIGSPKHRFKLNLHDLCHLKHEECK